MNLQFTINNLQGVARGGEHHGRGPELVSRWKGHGAAKRQDPTERGQSLFELVVAIAVSAMVITAVTSLASNSIRNSTFSKNKSLAATYAQQATEWLRGQRDNDINTFVAHAVTPTWCLSDLNWNTPGNCGADQVITGTLFSRQATFTVTTQNGKDVIEADVIVSWSDSQGMHEVTSATNLVDWRQR